MPLDCAVCPAPTALATIDYDPCVNSFGKVARIIIQRYATANNFDGTASPSTAINLEASWADLPDAAGNTKVVISPRLVNVTFGEQEGLEEDENFDGAPISPGSGPAPFSAEMRELTPDQAADIRALICERVPLVVYFIDDTGKFMCRLVESSIHNGIYVSQDTMKLIGPYREGARVNTFKHRIEFFLKATWYDTAAVVSPAAGFDPLTEIAPA